MQEFDKIHSSFAAHTDICLLVRVSLVTNIPFLQRASFSLRVSVMKAKNLMAKDANGKNIQAWAKYFLMGNNVFHEIYFVL